MSDKKPARRPIVSSLTGKPIEVTPPKEGVIPSRAKADRGDDSNDERLMRDVPPHWGR
ncbi:Uncharacterised protein [Mycobacteroides abscessus subsp. abscessus]|nr:Uncharacterised protein [Mycobacteroides abscessus subsp. abscessus]